MIPRGYKNRKGNALLRNDGNPQQSWLIDGTTSETTNTATEWVGSPGRQGRACSMLMEKAAAQQLMLPPSPEAAADGATADDDDTAGSVC